MEHQTQNWVKVAELHEVSEGKPKAIQMGEGRSIALFNVDGRIYATDNQCPHMGYPLTRGTVRNGILTCDWHRRSFDLEGGGCFHVECDDLRTFPVDIRGSEIWIEPGDLTYRRAAFGGSSRGGGREQEYAETLRILVDTGADMNDRRHFQNQTPLGIALKSGNSGAIDYLRGIGAAEV